MLKVRQRFLTLCTVLLISQGSAADSLKDIYELALQSDPTLRAARANFQVGRETKNISRAYLLPVISASADFSQAERNSESSQVYSFISADPFVSKSFSDTDSTTYSVSLTQAIFDMPAWYQFQRGKALSKSAAAQFAAEQQTLILRVSSAYLGALRAYDNHETRKAEQRAIQRQLEQTKERFEVGLLPVTDVHEAQAVFDDALVNSLEARGAVNIAFDALQVLTGKNHSVLSGLKDEFMAVNPVPLDSQDWVNFSLNNNYQLKVSELGKDASYNEAKAATAQLFPKVTANVRYSDSDQDGTQVSYLPSKSSSEISSLSDGHSFGISVSMPIWASGINAGRRQAKQRAIASSENFEVATRNTVQTARSRHQLVITNAARVKARNQAITSAESALGATQAGYEVGTRNIVDVLAAQRSVFQAKRNYANARYDYIFAMMSLKEVAGQLSPDDVYQLNAWLDPSLTVSK
ncbi:MAG: TolC family outer membrane protein [Porticoccaceae bacterium]|nr:TolC family outer membrane protein [Porticoccaceae bacterium]